MVSQVSRVVPWLVGVAVAVAAAQAEAQSNIDAGKSPAQLFSDTCGACHRSPRELKPTNAGFLREHYSTGGREAAAMAAYLASIGSDPRAVRERRPPTLGAGQAAAPAEASIRPGNAPGAEAGKPAPAKPRRPSDSVEAGRLPVAAAPTVGQEVVPAQTAAVPPASAALPAPHPAEEFEE
jgi:hypothetical protein